MIIDQLEIDPSRLQAGGACLTCKTPFAPKLQKELGKAYFADPYLAVHAKIPKEFQQLGAACGGATITRRRILNSLAGPSNKHWPTLARTTGR